MLLTQLKNNHIVDLSRLDKDSVVVDAGACMGEIVEDLRSRGLKCKIYAIEPNKSNFESLKNLENVISINKALVGKKRETINFYEISGRPQWGNVYQGDKVYPVKTIILDELPEEIDYLKMDIEGMELEVIEELKKDIPQMSIEFHGNNGTKIINRLKSLGYGIKEYPHNEIYAFKTNIS